MKIERNYLSNALSFRKEVFQHTRDELEKMTPEQKAEERRTQDKQFEMILKRISEREVDAFDVIDDCKATIFKMQSECALNMAKELEMDIVIETRGTKGIIQLFTDILLLEDPLQDWIYKSFLGLLTHAESLWFETVERYGENVIRFNLYYDLSEG